MANLRYKHPLSKGFACGFVGGMLAAIVLAGAPGTAQAASAQPVAGASPALCGKGTFSLLSACLNTGQKMADATCSSAPQLPEDRSGPSERVRAIMAKSPY